MTKEDNIMLGENILRLRKEANLSQETLGDIIGVTRQTISNWELEETAPNPEQLKLLSKAFNISIDDLLNNDIQNIIVKKVSDTEIVVNAIMKVLKVIGIAFVVFVIIIAIAALVIVFMEWELRQIIFAFFDSY